MGNGETLPRPLPGPVLACLMSLDNLAGFDPEKERIAQMVESTGEEIQKKLTGPSSGAKISGFNFLSRQGQRRKVRRAPAGHAGEPEKSTGIRTGTPF